MEHTEVNFSKRENLRVLHASVVFYDNPLSGQFRAKKNKSLPGH